MDSSEHIWQRAVVIQRDVSTVRVRFERLRQCQRCFEGAGCGAGVFSHLFSGRAAELRLRVDQPPAVGQAVQVGIRAGDMLRLAALLYGLPLLAFILAAALTATIAPHGWVGDVAGLAAGSTAALAAAILGGRISKGVLNPRLEMLSASARCGAVESGPSEGHI